MRKKLWQYFCTMLCLFLFVLVLYVFVWPLSIDGNSMKPTLSSGDRIILSRFEIFNKDIKKGDIIVCKLIIDNKKQNIVKRVIALPNEHLLINDNGVYVNNNLLKESYISNESINKNINQYLELTLGNDEYFIMGDNRQTSFDSRDIGPIKRSDIVGKVLFKWLPRIQNLTAHNELFIDIQNFF